jgi:hypothetical protein
VGQKAEKRKLGRYRPALGRLPWLAFLRRERIFLLFVFFDIVGPG